VGKLNTGKILKLKNTDKSVASNFAWPDGWAWDDRLLSVGGSDAKLREKSWGKNSHEKEW